MHGARPRDAEWRKYFRPSKRDAYDTRAKSRGRGDGGRRDGRNGTDRRRPQVTLTKITGPILYYSSEIGIEGTIQIGLPGRLQDITIYGAVDESKRQGLAVGHETPK